MDGNQGPSRRRIQCSHACSMRSCSEHCFHESAGNQEYLSHGFPWTLILKGMPIPVRHALEPNVS